MSERSHSGNGEAAAGDGPWWAGLGVVGGVLLVVLGLGVAGFLFFGGVDDDGDLTGLYGAGRVAAIGLVVAGGALLARRRRAGRGD